MGERSEAFMRTLVAIVSGIILGLWSYLIAFLFFVHFFYILISGRRSKRIAEHVNKWINFQYKFSRYLHFTTNERPFPFSEFPKVLEKVDITKKK